MGHDRVVGHSVDAVLNHVRREMPGLYTITLAHVDRVFHDIPQLSNISRKIVVPEYRAGFWGKAFDRLIEFRAQRS